MFTYIYIQSAATFHPGVSLRPDNPFIKEEFIFQFADPIPDRARDKIQIMGHILDGHAVSVKIQAASIAVLSDHGIRAVRHISNLAEALHLHFNGLQVVLVVRFLMVFSLSARFDL